MRGKEADGDQQGLQNGITPACAGKSSSGRVWCVQCGDHPRVCGEKSMYSRILRVSAGSPPRVRGKVFCHIGCAATRRITPACAGKSHPYSPQSCAYRDHPRVCGEKEGRLSDAVKMMGSPPRVRGKAVLRQGHALGRGITPACAGKSSHASRSSRGRGDHPRVCGEKAYVTADSRLY